MAYSRGQSNFVTSAIDSRDGYDHRISRAQNEVSQQPVVNIPVIAASPSHYSTATYPGLRGGSGFDRDGPARQQTSPDFLGTQCIYF